MGSYMRLTLAAGDLVSEFGVDSSAGADMGSPTATLQLFMYLITAS